MEPHFSQPAFPGTDTELNVFDYLDDASDWTTSDQSSGGQSLAGSDDLENRSVPVSPVSTSKEISASHAKTQLQSKERRIRLLQSVDWEEPQTRFRFLVYPVDDVPPYVALSYTWGPEWPTKTVHVDGFAIQVRENLWDALQIIQRNIRHIWKAAKFDSSPRCEYLLGLASTHVTQFRLVPTLVPLG